MPIFKLELKGTLAGMVTHNQTTMLPIKLEAPALLACTTFHYFTITFCATFQ